MEPTEQCPPTDADAVATEMSWGTRLFGHMVRHLPETSAPVERRLLRTAFAIHRMADAIGTNPADSDIWKLTDALHALTVTAQDACAAGISERYVGDITAMSMATADRVLDIALSRMTPTERMAKLGS